MKKILALLLAMMMLFAVTAQAEETYMRQITQKSYINTLFITPESYPQVCISPYYASSVYGSNYKEPWFISFSMPANTMATSFDFSSCHLIDEEELIQYDYQATDSYAYETFLNKCENDDYIIYDGSDKKAAYLEPDRAYAYGLLGVPEIEKGAKLYSSIYMGGLGRNVTTEKRVQMLTDAITAEMDRILAEMTVQKMETYWSEGKYTGVKMPSLEYGDQMLVFDFPNMDVYYEDGSVETSEMFLIDLDDNRMTGLVRFDEELMLSMDVSMETYSYVKYQKEENPADVFAVTLSNGVEFDVYMSYFSKNGNSSLVYCSHVLAENAGYSGDEVYYLNIDLDGDGLTWNSLDDLKADLEAVVGNMYFVDPETDPYVPGAVAAPAADPAPAQNSAPANTWNCPECENENSGNFCSNCGTKKPETKGPWACPSCNQENSGNFCSNCGTKKP